MRPTPYLPIAPSLRPSHHGHHTNTATPQPDTNDHDHMNTFGNDGRDFSRALRVNAKWLSAWTLMGHEYIEMKNSAAAIQVLLLLLLVLFMCAHGCDKA